jgi:hypothetical protein
MPIAFKSQQTPSSFWQWIAAHLDELRLHADDPNSEIFERLIEQLRRYDSDLGVEISKSEIGEILVTITAYGNRESFPTVKALVEACPSIGGLKAMAFRQSEGAEFSVQVGHKEFSPSNTWFEPMKGIQDPSSLGVMVFFPDADEVAMEERRHIAQVMLQAILGEYESAMKLDYIEVANSQGRDLQQFIKLAEIASYISWHEKRHAQTRQ